MRKTLIITLLLITSPAWAGKRRVYEGACLPRDVMHYETICDVSRNTTLCVKDALVDVYLNSGDTLGACQPRTTTCSTGNTVACCQYPTGTTTVDNTCDNCPDFLGGAAFAGCLCDAYADGYGQTCIPVGQ